MANPIEMIANLSIRARFDEAMRICSQIPDEDIRARMLQLVTQCRDNFKGAFGAALKMFELGKTSENTTPRLPRLDRSEVQDELDKIAQAEENAFLDQELSMINEAGGSTHAYKNASILFGPKTEVLLELKQMTPADDDDRLVHRFLFSGNSDSKQEQVIRDIKSMSIERSDTSPHPKPENPGGPIRRFSRRPKSRTSYEEPPDLVFRKEVAYSPRPRSAPPVPPRRKQGFLPVAPRASPSRD